MSNPDVAQLERYLPGGPEGTVIESRGAHFFVLPSVGPLAKNEYNFNIPYSNFIDKRVTALGRLGVVCAFECTYVSISESLWLANVAEVFL